MQKQLKKTIKKKKLRKTFFRVKKLFNTTLLYHFENLLVINKILSLIKLKAIIRVTSNNIFCTLIKKKEKKIIFTSSVGKNKLKTSQRKIKFTLKKILKIFYQKINYLLKKKKIKSILIEIIAPLKVKKILIKNLKIFKKIKKNILINIKPKKCFNGCIPKKKIRKKKKKMRVLK